MHLSRRMDFVGSAIADLPERSTKGSLLLLELDVDDVFRLRAVGAAVGRGFGAWTRAGAGPRSGARRGARGRVEVLGHRLAGPLELVDGTIDRPGVFSLLGLVDLVDGGPQGRLVGVAELVLVLLEELLELIDALLGG